MGNTETDGLHLFCILVPICFVRIGLGLRCFLKYLENTLNLVGELNKMAELPVEEQKDDSFLDFVLEHYEMSIPGEGEETNPDLKYHFAPLEKPSSACLSRVKNDLRALTNEPIPGIFAAMDESVATTVHALVIGPNDTPYEGGFFYFIMNFPANYPINPPKVALKTTGGGKIRFNPNLYKNGYVCLSILNTWEGPRWNPTQNIGSVLLSIRSVMNEEPYFNEPGFMGLKKEPKSQEMSKKYNNFIRHETLRIAVCDIMENKPQGFPDDLKEEMEVHFAMNYGKYEASAKAKLTLDGETMFEMFREIKQTLKFSDIVAKLQALNEKLKQSGYSLTEEA